MGANITDVSRLVPGLLERLEQSPKEIPASVSPPEASFAGQLTEFLNSVNELQGEAGRIQEAFMAGEPVELHQVMIKAEQAGLSMDLLLEIRNKLVTAYNQLMRMPM